VGSIPTVSTWDSFPNCSKKGLMIIFIGPFLRSGLARRWWARDSAS